MKLVLRYVDVQVAEPRFAGSTNRTQLDLSVDAEPREHIVWIERFDTHTGPLSHTITEFARVWLAKRVVEPA
jgi:hypothetical protein